MSLVALTGFLYWLQIPFLAKLFFFFFLHNNWYPSQRKSRLIDKLSNNHYDSGYFLMFECTPALAPTLTPASHLAAAKSSTADVIEIPFKKNKWKDAIFHERGCSSWSGDESGFMRRYFTLIASCTDLAELGPISQHLTQSAAFINTLLWRKWRNKILAF